LYTGNTPGSSTLAGVAPPTTPLTAASSQAVMPNPFM
jgi:hypothetical protein